MDLPARFFLPHLLAFEITKNEKVKKRYDDDHNDPKDETKKTKKKAGKMMRYYEARGEKEKDFHISRTQSTNGITTFSLQFFLF